MKERAPRNIGKNISLGALMIGSLFLTACGAEKTTIPNKTLGYLNLTCGTGNAVGAAFNVKGVDTQLSLEVDGETIAMVPVHHNGEEIAFPNSGEILTSMLADRRTHTVELDELSLVNLDNSTDKSQYMRTYVIKKEEINCNP